MPGTPSWSALASLGSALPGSWHKRASPSGPLFNTKKTVIQLGGKRFLMGATKGAIPHLNPFALRSTASRAYFQIACEAVFTAEPADMSLLHAAVYAKSGGRLDAGFTGQAPDTRACGTGIWRARRAGITDRRIYISPSASLERFIVRSVTLLGTVKRHRRETSVCRDDPRSP